MKIWLFFGLMFMVGFASPAFASDKVALLTQKEILENGETAQRYMNGRNLAKYLENTRQPISVLREISGATEGRQLSNLVKDYVAYEDAIGGRDLRSVQYYNQYRDSSLVDEFEEFYGVNGANADNAGEPVTADLLADTLDQLLPSYLEQNPAVMARLKALQGDYKYDDDEVKDLVKSTGLDAKVVKELIKSMNSGRVASSAIIDVGTRVEEDAQEFVLKNFPNELAQAKQIRDRADGYFAAHDEAMVEYETFISNLSSAQFKRQFQEYAKYFRADQKDQAMQPYINQAQAILDRAEENQARGEQELQNLEQYIDRFERQKLEPAIKRHNRDVQRNSSLQTLPKFSASGVFAFASNAISITGGSSVGELATDSARDAFSSAVGGVEVPNSLEVDSVPTADVTKSLSGSFNSAQSGDPDDLFPLPTNAVTRYWRPSDNVRFGSNDWKPLCDDSKKASTGSSGKITRFSDEDCLDRYYRFTPNGGKVSQFFSLVKTADGNGSLSGGQIPLSVTNASKSSLKDVFRESSKKTNSFITNMKGASLVLTKRQLSAAQSLQNEGLKENGVDTRSAQLETKAVTGDGEEFERFNPVFSNDKDEAVNQAIQGGYCLVIEDKDGKYRKDGKKVSPVQIKDPSHPFSPRHKVEWLNYPDPLSTVCGGSGGNSSTSSTGSNGFSTDGFSSDGFGNSINNAGKVASGVQQAAQTAQTVNNAVQTGQNIVNTVTNIPGAISNAAGNAIGAATGAVTGAVSGAVSSATGAATSYATGVVTSAKDSIGAVVSSNGQIVKAGEVIGNVAGSASAARDAAGGVITASGEIVNNAGQVVGNAIGGVTGVASSAVNGVVNSAGQITNSAGQVVGNIAGGVTGATSQLVGGVVNSAGQIVNVAGDVVGNIAGSVGGVFGVVTGGAEALTAAARQQAMEFATKQATAAVSAAATSAATASAGAALGSAAANVVSISKTCGTDRKNEIGGIYAWQIYGKSNAITKDYSYYKKPIIDNGGKILTNPKRLGIYTGVAYAAYAVCTAVTQGSAQKFCCDVAEHAGCQVGILPAVDPVNKLPLTYTKAHAQDDDDEKLPHLYDNAYDSYNVGVQTSLDKNNNGYNWMTSQPASNFGFNGPWVKSVVTGEVGFGEIEDMDKDDYAMYMLAIAGVNDGYSPGEDNNFSREAHNMSCGAGGWEELKRYQENCARQIGVNCICNYQKSFFEKSSWAYVLSRYSTKGLSIDNAEKSRIVKREVDGKMLSRSEDITERLNWDAKILMSRDGHPVNAQANYAVGGDEDEIYPGGDWVKGLSNAKKGSMIVMQQTAGKELTDPDATHGQFKRPWMAAYVEERNDTTGCITVSTMNNHSIFLDACGNSENAGVETKFEICPPGMTGKSTYKYPGGDIPSCASNSEYYTCQEDRAGWNAWIVKNPYAG